MHDPLFDSDLDGDEIFNEKTPSPEDLARQAHEPATVAYVRRELAWRVARHKGECSALRSVKKWRLWIAAGFGALTVLQFGWLMAGRALIREAVRDVVREELAGRMAARAKPDAPVRIISTAEAADVIK